MKYIQPRNVKETLHLIKKLKGRAKLKAGGTNLIPDMRAKTIHPEVLIDISHLKGLSFIEEKDGKIRIGSLTTISELVNSKAIQTYAPVLLDAARQFGNPLLRNKATIGGNLANASPAADTAVPLLIFGGHIGY